jgi:hypothetical protein
MVNKGFPLFIAFILTFIVVLSTNSVMAQEKETGYKITDQSIKDLKSEGVPDNILGKLQSIKNQEFAREKDFLDKIKETIGNEQADKFKSLILRNTKKLKEGKGIPIGEIVVAEKWTDQWSDLVLVELPHSVESIDREFMDDYGVNTVQDAVKRLSGVMPAIEGLYPRRNEDITIRGQQYSPVLMNGFVIPF